MTGVDCTPGCLQCADQFVQWAARLFACVWMLTLPLRIREWWRNRK
jgi:hypothetical protein